MFYYVVVSLNHFYFSKFLSGPSSSSSKRKITVNENDKYQNTNWWLLLNIELPKLLVSPTPSHIRNSFIYSKNSLNFNFFLCRDTFFFEFYSEKHWPTWKKNHSGLQFLFHSESEDLSPFDELTLLEKANSTIKETIQPLLLHVKHYRKQAHKITTWQVFE